ncbi:Uncharacterised protein [Mycobacteroides abscessus subsp. abscessus]|nr:Uncharacterised protein [Mycobacteroides abscessus subsp. abscessus]
MVDMPDGLSSGGAALWEALTEAHDLDTVQLVQLTEVCRMKDRLDKLDALLRGDIDAWALLMEREGQPTELVVNSALDKANTTANQMKQLLAAMRLPDDVGKRPQQRGGARGAYAPKVEGTSAASKARNRWGA